MIFLAVISDYLRSASAVGRSVDHLFWGLTLTTGAVAGLVMLALLVFCLRYRRGSRASRAPLRISTNAVEITWTLIPIFIFLGFFAWAAELYYQMAAPPMDAEEIHVLGKQWMWKTQHLNGRSEIDELHVEVGRPVALLMISQDVIHSFYIPAFRLKQDVVPGNYTREWFTATRTGTFPIFCSEYCGTNHSAMTGFVHVLSPANYTKWLNEGGAPTALATAGQQLFMARGCAGCHSEHGTVHAPLLNGIYGQSVALANQRTVIADERYLRDSILLPNKDVVAGYQPVMPSFQGQLSEEQVLQLIAYLKTLGPSPSPAP